jgi:hypothetical protein
MLKNRASRALSSYAGGDCEGRHDCVIPTQVPPGLNVCPLGQLTGRSGGHVWGGVTEVPSGQCAVTAGQDWPAETLEPLGHRTGTWLGHPCPAGIVVPSGQRTVTGEQE